MKIRQFLIACLMGRRAYWKIIDLAYANDWYFDQEVAQALDL